MVDVVEDLIEATTKNDKKQELIDNICIRHERTVPAKFLGAFAPKNEAEQKERFLQRKYTPQFSLSNPILDIENLLLKRVFYIMETVHCVRMLKFTSIYLVKLNVYWILL